MAQTACRASEPVVLQKGSALASPVGSAHNVTAAWERGSRLGILRQDNSAQAQEQPDNLNAGRSPAVRHRTLDQSTNTQNFTREQVPRNPNSRLIGAR